MVTRGATVRWFALGAALVPGLLAQDAPDEVETESGLRYVDLRIGDGESPGSGDGVEIHYVHTREDGTVVEETREWGDPVRFRLGGRTPVSPLFEEGLRSMCAGGLRRLRIVPEPDAREPAGALGSGPPGVPLLYEVELVSVRHPPPRPAYDETKLERNASGVAWTVLAPGSGEALDSGRIAGLQLSAWLADGRLVECTPLSGRSYRFLLGAAGTPGWTADLAGMRVGERRLLVVPPGSGFGEDGVPGVIPPGATLVLDVLLEEVGPPPRSPGSTRRRSSDTRPGSSSATSRSAPGPRPTGAGGPSSATRSGSPRARRSSTGPPSAASPPASTSAGRGSSGGWSSAS